MAKEIDLKDYIKTSNAACLNRDESTYTSSVLAGGQGPLKSNSDIDHQLLITIPFTEKVNLRKLIITAEVKEGSEESGPKDIKLFANQNLDFDDADSMKALQTIALDADNLKGSPVDLKFVKFQNVTSLTIFVDSNQDDSDVTVINAVTIIGKPRSGMNMKELKKVG